MKAWRPLVRKTQALKATSWAAEQKKKCRLIQKWFAHFTSKQSAKTMIWPKPAPHESYSGNTTMHPPRVYLMEFTSTSISTALHLSIFICPHLWKKVCRLIITEQQGEAFSEQKCNSVERKTFEGFSFMENSMPNCCGMFAVHPRISIQLLLHIRPNICRWSRDPIRCLPRSLENTFHTRGVQVIRERIPFV